MTNIKNCASSYLAFRYIANDDEDFCDGMKHQNIKKIDDSEKIKVSTAVEIGNSIEEQLSKYRDKKCGILLSGGMDSAIVASYMNGGNAYTFRYLNGEFQKEELERAEYYAKEYNLELKYVDINWNTVEQYVDSCMARKCCAVHSIEPQILKAAIQAKNDGIEIMFIGESSDLVFGGMDGLLAKDWTFDEFVRRYTFLNPKDALVDPQDVSYVYERYRKGDSIDFMTFMDDVFAIESSSSYFNAFGVAKMSYFDPYAQLKMSVPLDLNRVRNGEPKYLIRELMKLRYPRIEVPRKNPMPRPVDFYFKDYKGPKHKLFKTGLDMSKFTGNQKWQLWCLDRFLNKFCDANQ